MKAVLAFSGLVLVIFFYFAITGYKCAAASGRIVEKATGKKISYRATAPELLMLPFALWLNGFAAFIRGTKRHIARDAEAYIDEAGMTGSDKRKIREAVRDYRKTHSLF